MDNFSKETTNKAATELEITTMCMAHVGNQTHNNIFWYNLENFVCLTKAIIIIYINESQVLQ